MWRFRQMARGELNIDPVQEEFFSTEELENLSSSLVRETVQNSLDAHNGNGPVEVAFTFGTASDSRGALRASPFFRGLVEPLSAKANGLRGLPSDTESLDFVTVEDFGTRGLVGDTHLDDDPEEDIDIQDFYYFWRNIGRSKKGLARLGRWGLGKQVFPAASRINAFFGLTQREGDNGALLMGQAVLKVHRLPDGHKYFPYGYFGQFPDNDAFAVPLVDTDEVDQFKELFSLRRAQEPGLSVVVPYPRSEIQPKAVLTALIMHYFHPILSGELVAHVSFMDQHTRLAADTIRSEIDRVLPERSEDLTALIDFTDWALSLPEEAHEILPLPELDRTPKWNSYEIPEPQEDRLRKMFEHGGRMAVRVPVTVHRIEQAPSVSWFSLYVEQDNSLQKGVARFIREGINITYANPYLDRGARGLVVIHDAELSSLLGDAEPPAHDRWDQRSLKFRDKYIHGASTIGFVKKSIQEVYRRIALSKEDKDVNLLRDLFFVDRETLELPDQKRKPGRKKGKRESGGDVDPIESKGQMIKVEQLPDENGFRIVSCGNGRRIKAVSVKAAYMVRMGSPLKRYHPFDFEFDKNDLRVKCTNARAVRCERNELEAEIDEPDFEVRVTGFDDKRDLFIKATAEPLES